MDMAEEGTIFVDIETTGLKKETSLIQLIGCGFYDKEDKDHPLHIIQWFNNDAVSEEEILQSFLHFLGKHKGPLCTFNGESFDLPFLSAHMEYNELSLPWNQALENHESLDLFKLLRGFAPLFGLENGKQKSWEVLLGLDREDLYDGGKLIPVYKEYLKTKKEEDLQKILLHNMEDVKGLALLSVCLSYDQFRSGDFTILGVDESEHDGIIFKLKLDKPCPKALPALSQSMGHFTMPSADHITLTIPYQAGKMYHFYPNHQDYYYLPLEDRAIHKSIGAYVDKEHRRKATAKTCYMPLESLFFPIPKKACGYGFVIEDSNAYQATIYQESYGKKSFYLPFEELFTENEIRPIVKQYLTNVISFIFLEAIHS